jgi:hypothetical protein
MNCDMSRLCACLFLGLAAFGASKNASADTLGLISNSKLSEEDPTVLKLNFGAGLTYEFQSLDGVLLTGSGPSAEMNLEFVLGRRRSWGVGARYRRLSLLGPEVSASGATIEQISNIDYTLFARFGWLDLFGGVEQFSGDIFVIDSGSSGSKRSDSKLLPVGGVGILLYSGKGLKGRLQGIASSGQAFGYSLTSIRVNASLQIAFP